MKVIVTILQCKRVVLPYLFLEYCLPKMQAICGFEIKAYLIQHLKNVNATPVLDTNKLSDNKFNDVTEWTKNGRYSNATIIKHFSDFPAYPHLPSVIIGIEKAIEEKADFHLWIEDDALVCDFNCMNWLNIMGENEIGIYHFHKEKYVNCAYMLSSIGFDKKILPELKESSNWNISESMYHYVDGVKQINQNARRLEPRIAKYSGMKWALLNPEYAARINMSKRESSLNLIKLVKKIAPQEIDLLSIDFDSSYLNSLFQYS